TSRWTVLRDALTRDGTGLVALLQDQVAFGLHAYDGGLSLPGIKTPACPRVVEVGPALDNLARIRDAYPSEPMGASTPTHYALLSLRDRIRATSRTARGPAYVVLATDGRPNICDFHDGVPETPATAQQAVNTIADLATMDIQTFAISMAGSDAVLRTHLEAVATAGGTG